VDIHQDSPQPDALGKTALEADRVVRTGKHSPDGRHRLEVIRSTEENDRLVQVGGKSITFPFARATRSSETLPISSLRSRL